ncbi:MAG: galactose-1-phosphate uridylyltransferase [Candidatus Aminicenantes bacterium RBG_13_63_10]|nr:MAG: galactose-1-phosphate uridylyltransferase [Candidatus Aminicenantes bacterium RBG_13_63_10]
MSQLRKDPISGRWVIIAGERSKRPDDFRKPNAARPDEPAGFCPFCEGNESKTPPEIYALRPDSAPADSPGWRVRIVPNKFPALSRGAQAPREGEGLFVWMDGIGVHEVVIETPVHGREMADLELEHIQDVLRIYRERILSIGREKQYRYIQVFKNKGPEAGASLSHPHTQIVATPIVPKRVKEETYGGERFFLKYGECVFCRIIREELERGERVIYRNEHFCVLAPYASRFPFEMRLNPLRHSPHFIDLTESELSALACALKTALSRLKSALSDPPYNFLIHQAPNPRLNANGGRVVSASQSFHWHLEIIPVLTRVAGFEWGTGFYINPVSPEVAAETLSRDEFSSGKEP